MPETSDDGLADVRAAVEWDKAAANMTEAQRQRNLMRWLDWRWRNDYVCFSGDGEYSATRLDDHQAIVAASADELQSKITADYDARPVVRERADAGDDLAEGSTITVRRP